MPEEIHRRRRGMRRAVSFECSVQSELWDHEVLLQASNLSEEGMWLETPLGLEPGEPLVVSFTPPGARQRVWAAAKVVRLAKYKQRGTGIALSFTYLSDTHRDVLACALYGRPPVLPDPRPPLPRPAVIIASEPLAMITKGPAPHDAIVATVVGAKTSFSHVGRTMQVMDEELRGDVVVINPNATMQVHDDEVREL